MTVSSVSSNSVAAAPSVKPQAEAAEVKAAGRDAKMDGDTDDVGVAAAKAPTPTVNLNGQTIGKLINVTA